MGMTATTKLTMAGIEFQHEMNILTDQLQL